MDPVTVSARRATLLLVVLCIGGVVGLALLSQTVQNSTLFGRWHEAVLIGNALGALALVAVLCTSVAQLLAARRRGEPGAALRLRLLGPFAAVAVLPVLAVFLLSLQFLNRGIETWSDDRVARGLERSLELSRAALDAELGENLAKTQEVAGQIERLPEGKIVSALPGLRRAVGATEMSVFGRNYRFVATSAENPFGALPELLSEDALLQLPRNGRYVAVEPVGADQLRIRAAVIFGSNLAIQDSVLTLQALYPVSDQLGSLAKSVRGTYARYGELVYLREPLETSFTLSLTVAVMLALFAALYGAFLFARRLAEPIRDLVDGTQAIAAGRLDTRLAVKSRDDLGALVESFNDMAARLSAADAESRSSAEEIERGRASLAAILGRLSSGVIAVDSQRCIRMANEAAEVILQAELRAAAGEPLEDVAIRHPQLREFLAACEARNDESPDGWREQMPLAIDAGSRRTLMCAAAPLPDVQGLQAGFVLVFDDITGVLKAQRDAAWGEVARRLAHEIKNPLTPIQLSAERIRRRYLAGVPADDTDLLDRATHTIVQQVAAMRDMVNAFSDYARAPEVRFESIDVNRLVREVVELYHGPQLPAMHVDADPALGHVEADAGRLRQLLHNLLRNACDAIEEHTDARVTVTTHRCLMGTVAAVEIRIDDNGAGIDPELLPRIFDPYVTSKSRGTGLGLAIVRRLVEEHGGTVAAANLAGGGASLRVTLPLTQRYRESNNDNRPRRAAERR
ncbi:MAG: HAMP domain-containing protein [Gammaproteobacteria bacterium]|nr:HAMP domain-containing protein [Gammaproteobacteria bacterium]